MSSISIYQVLTSIPHNPHYVNRYHRFIIDCMDSNKFLSEDVYTEKHHILPKALFPDYGSFSKHPWNKATLTARQHFIAHWILAKAYGGSMWQAFFLMSKTHKVKLNSKIYEKAKTEYSSYKSKSQKGKNNPFYGKKHSKEFINKARNKKLSKETRVKIALSNSKPCPEYKKLKINNTLKGRKRPENIGIGNPTVVVYEITSPDKRLYHIASIDIDRFCKNFGLVKYTLLAFKNKGAVARTPKMKRNSFNTLGWEIKVLGRLKKLDNITLFSTF